MSRIFSNSPDSRSYVVNPFDQMLRDSTRAHLAAPYFTEEKSLVAAVNKGKEIDLLIGLNEITSPSALEKIHGRAGVSIRYFTSRFHAKIYVFDATALLGSANLTLEGLQANREAVISLGRDNDVDSENFEDVRTLFDELWNSAKVLTRDDLDSFKRIRKHVRQSGQNRLDPQQEFEKEFGKVQPPNADVDSLVVSREHTFLETLRREVYEQYRPSFLEVTSVLDEHGFRHPELEEFDIESHANRLLNYIKLIHVKGDEAWQHAPQRSPDKRCDLVERYFNEWKNAPSSMVPPEYADMLRTVKQTFGTPGAIQSADKDKITEGLMSIHAFYDQRRFVKGGEKNLPAKFWKDNRDNLDRVKSTLVHLLHGSGDFIQRLHDILYDPSKKLGRFGYFCALELYGTVNPDECPPMNGRIAKALRFLGYGVRGN